MQSKNKILQMNWIIYKVDKMRFKIGQNRQDVI